MVTFSNDSLDILVVTWRFSRDFMLKFQQDATGFCTTPNTKPHEIGGMEADSGFFAQLGAVYCSSIMQAKVVGDCELNRIQSNEKNPGWIGLYRGLYYPVIWGKL